MGEHQAPYSRRRGNGCGLTRRGMRGLDGAGGFFIAEGGFVDQEVGAGSGGRSCLAGAGVASDHYAPANTGRADERRRIDDASIRKRDDFPFVELSPERSFGNPEIARHIGMKAAASFILDKRITNRCGAAVIHRKWENHVSLAGDRRAGGDLGDFERKGETFDAESVGAFHHRLNAFWSPEAQRFSARPERQSAEEAEEAEKVISVKVREVNIADGERDSVAHHLALCAFAAIDEHGLALADERDRRNTALNGWAGGGSS